MPPKKYRVKMITSDAMQLVDLNQLSLAIQWIKKHDGDATLFASTDAEPFLMIGTQHAHVGDYIGWRETEGFAIITAEVFERLFTDEPPGKISDGYHTFDQLYDFRMAYNALLFNEWAIKGIYDVHMSYKHADGKPCFDRENYFVVVAETPLGQISNHYHGKDAHLFHLPERERANEWDGHTPEQALERLMKLAEQH